MRKKLFSFLLASLAGVFLLTTGAPIHGAEAPQGQNLRISPPKQDVTVEKGSAKTQQVTITNEQISPVTLAVSFKNITAAGEDGSIEPTDEVTPYDLKQWATFSENEFTLGAKQSKTIDVTFTVPTVAEPGGHYGWLQFTPQIPGNTGNAVGIKGSVATLYLLTVPGPVKQGGDIKDFYLTRQDGHKIGGFYLGHDLQILTRLHNSGNLHFAGSPIFTTFNQFGQQTFSQQAAPGNVFPQSDRKYEAQWSKVKTGYYKVETFVTFPDEGQKSKVIRVLVVTPLVLGLVVAGILLLIVIVVVLRHRRHRIKT